MTKNLKLIHKILFYIAIGLTALTILYVVCIWTKLPESFGVHYGPDGDIDIYGGKDFLFYPLIANILFQVLFGFLGKIATKLKINKNFSEKIENVFRWSVVYFCDVIQILFAIFYGIWIYRGIHFKGMIVTVPMILFFAMFLFVPAIILAYIVTIIIVKIKNKRENGL